MGFGMDSQRWRKRFRLIRTIAGSALGFAAMLAVPAQAQQGGEWGWIGGSSTLPDDISVGGVYGTLGVAAPSNFPGGRTESLSWGDTQGNGWLFGGYGADYHATQGDLNDLWTYSTSTGEWKWVSGSNKVWIGPPAYGTRGTPSAIPPSGRILAAGWTGKSGLLWLFGGAMYEPCCIYNDLWSFNPADSTWTWESGSNGFLSTDQLGTPGSPGVYGTLGIADAANIPGSRFAAYTWTDPQGRFWLGGGYGFDANSKSGYLDDLWMYDPGSGMWTWEGGDSTLVPGIADYGRSGVYGTMGHADKTSHPGSRYGASGWIDKNGIGWVLGGFGFDSEGNEGPLDDLWSFTSSTGEWTWVSGIETVGTGSVSGIPGSYGTEGVPAPGNHPGSRVGADTWTDTDGNLWLFGGNGFDANNYLTDLNDLWMYSPSTNEWAWMAGSDAATFNGRSQPGIYGTRGEFSAGNTPGARVAATSWTDRDGNLWLFGGDGRDAGENAGFLNDLWEYKFPATFTLSAANPSLALSPGSSATDMLTAAPKHGFNSQITFACSGLPAGVTCTFNPATVTPSGGAATTQLTIAASSSASNALPSRNPLLPATTLALAGGLLLWRRRRALACWTAAVLLSAGLLTVSACGGGGGSSGGGNPPPPPSPTTATVAVTASSGALQQTTTIALTINH
jgi:hypothetical protein